MKEKTDLRIGYDAKRLFHNSTGLGNYSRIVVDSISRIAPENHYYLYTPKARKSTANEYFFSDRFNIRSPLFMPASIWRSFLLSHDIKKDALDIYHGLSHEIPYDLDKTQTKSIVTIHDLIYRFYPDDFKIWDRLIYDKKFRYACDVADMIIAVSESTKNDLVREFGISQNRIKVIYPSLARNYLSQVTEENRKHVKKKYGLPERFILSVGSMIPRKNLLSVIKALKTMDPSKTPQLVAIGNGSDYLRKVLSYIDNNKMNDRIRILTRIDNQDLPMLYSSAILMIYVSKYEGFGFPVIESLSQGTPVITTRLSSLPEAGGPGALFVDPDDEHSIAEAIQKILVSPEIGTSLGIAGKKHVSRFNDMESAKSILHAYDSVLKN